MAIAIFVIGVKCAAGDAKVLLDPAQRAGEALHAGAGATLAFTIVEGRRVARIDTDHSHPWPGVTLKAPGAGWDLSPFARVDVELRNPTDASVRVDVRVDNPNADGTHDCVTDGVTLAPHQAGVAHVALVRAKPRWAKFDLPGMRGVPWEKPPEWRKEGEGTIDPRKVSQVLIFCPEPKVDQRFEILLIRAEAKFVDPAPLLKEEQDFFPFVDAFGQYMHRDWPGKTHNLPEITKQREEESHDLDAHAGPADWDRFGGYKDGPALAATGAFRAEKHDGKWYLVDPDGKLFFSNGIDCVTAGEGGTPVEKRANWFSDLPPESSAFGSCYFHAREIVMGPYAWQHPLCFNFTQANLMRKYGPDWRRPMIETAHRRLRSWGINTIGGWSDPEIYSRHKSAYTVSLDIGSRSIEGSRGYWGKMVDPFDPSFAQAFERAIGNEKSASAQDPWCIGYFVDNELSWGDDGVSLALATLASPANQPAKIAFLSDLKTHYGQIDKLNAAWLTHHASWEALASSTQVPDVAPARPDLQAFYGHLARTYFKTIRDALKAAAPQRLYLGCRFAARNAIASSAAAEFCDVVSFNVYQPLPNSPPLPIDADMPLLIGEFHFGARDRGCFHPGLVPVEDQAARARAYKSYLDASIADPRIVGCHWFQYGDEPTIGRVFDGENYQIGFVDIVDRPYPEMVQTSREVAKALYARRASGK